MIDNVMTMLRKASKNRDGMFWISLRTKQYDRPKSSAGIKLCFILWLILNITLSSNVIGLKDI